MFVKKPPFGLNPKGNLKIKKSHPAFDRGDF